MNGGFAAFIAGVIAVLLAWIAGRRSSRKETETRMKVQVVEAKAEARKAETERDMAVSTAQNVQQHTAESDAIHRYFLEFEETRKEAEDENNVDMAIEAARKLAERAVNWQKRNSQ